MDRIHLLFWTSLFLCLGLGVAVEVRSEGSYLPIIKPGHSEPSCAKGKNYCETIPEGDYPEKAILKILKGLKNLPSDFISYIFKEKNNENMYDTNSGFHPRLNTLTIGLNKSEDQLCRTLPTIIRPVAVKTQHDGWRYVVNDITIKKADFPQLKWSEATYEQSVEIEACDQGSRMCSKTGQARCEQRYRTTKLLVLHPTGTHLYTDLFPAPNCCQCSLY